jgi:hypothetical protein
MRVAARPAAMPCSSVDRRSAGNDVGHAHPTAGEGGEHHGLPNPIAQLGHHRTGQSDHLRGRLDPLAQHDQPPAGLIPPTRGVLRQIPGGAQIGQMAMNARLWQT